MSRPSTQSVSALREIARGLSAAWDLDSTLDLIARKTTEIMQVDSCTIYLLDADQEVLQLRASTGLAARALGRATLKVGEGMTGHAVSQNKPVYAADAQHDPHFKWVAEAEETAFRSLLAVPLLVEPQHKPIGALNVQTVQPHTYQQHEIELLSLIADLAAGTLAKARLLDQQRQRIEEMETLATVSEVMTSPQYLDDILQVVVEMATKSMDAAVCSLFLINEAGTHLELRAAQRTTIDYHHRVPLPLGKGVTGKVAVTGMATYIADVRTDPAYVGSDLATKEGQPLFAGEQYAGLSQMGLYYIGGILKHINSLLAILAPSTNSYRRLVPGYEAPVVVAYSARNRSAAVRIPMYTPSPKAKRVEFRCPDPAANPYLAFAAMLMAGLDGIKNQIDPGNPADIDLFEEENINKVTMTKGKLNETLDALEADHDYLLEGGVFTEDLLEAYISYKREEEVGPVSLRPHPYEFVLYYGI